MRLALPLPPNPNPNPTPNPNQVSALLGASLQGAALVHEGEWAKASNGRSYSVCSQVWELPSGQRVELKRRPAAGGSGSPALTSRRAGSPAKRRAELDDPLLRAAAQAAAEANPNPTPNPNPNANPNPNPKPNP